MRCPVRTGGALAAALLLGALGCGGPAQLRYEESVERAPVDARHAIHDERLRERMRALGRLRDERLPQAMDVGREERRRRKELVGIARALERSAAQLADAAPEGEARPEFLARARALEQSAGALAEEAGALTPDELDARLSDIDSTCDTCHARFRTSGDRLDAH